MHVAFVAGNLCRLGGIETQTVLMARELTKLGVEVTLVTLGSTVAKAFPQFRVVAGPWDPGVYGTFAAVASAVQWLAALVTLAGRVDIVQAQSVHPMGMAVAAAGRWLRVATAARISSSGVGGEVRELLKRPASVLRRVALEWIRRYVALSPEGVEDLPEPLRSRAVVIPNGVDLGHFRPPHPGERQQARGLLGIGQGELVYCYSGRLAGQKAVDELIDAWAEASPPYSRLLIVGDGPEAAELMNRATQSARGNSVSFVGRMRDVRAALWASDVAFQPSRVEGLSNSLLEAMACGVPVIARNLRCYAGLLEPEATFDDKQSLYSLIERSSDPGWREQRVSHNLEVVAQFDAPRVARRYLDFYRDLLASW